jgi:Ca-activated chloride channel family protein
MGYENRKLRREDFKNDKIDAGEIGAGHSVTALYEITLAENKPRIEPLRYGKTVEIEGPRVGELAHLRLRYKQPDSDTSKLIEWPLHRNNVLLSLGKASDDLRFSASVAAFAELLRGGKQTGTFSYKDVIELSRRSRGHDPFGYRGEFIKLVDLAQSLSVANTGR